MNFLIVATGLFSLGLYGVLTRRDVIAVLASVEIMLGGATVLLVGLAAMPSAATSVPADTGVVGAVALLIIVIVAAEAAVGLALLVAVARATRRTRVDELTEVQG
ncbi:MAG: NADH-quinone oxidoreductase subunit NuoK [Coriobacteriia bacterium]|nr:NADH-quinone oxidoreductase subunit NuoK [Coriobacteriia bacterium]